MCSCRPRPARIALGILLTLSAYAPRALCQHEVAPPNPALDWLRDYLSEFSGVEFPFSPGGATGELVTTRTPGLRPDGAFVLTYERVKYAQQDPSQIEIRQLILYDVKPAQLDPLSIAILPVFNRQSGEYRDYWMVTVKVRENAEFVEYDNLFESRGENREPELTRSRGRVREVVLGYFWQEEQAKTLAERFRAYLDSFPAPAALTPPDQSDA